MRLFLVDSHPIFREGLKSVVANARDLTVVGESATHEILNDPNIQADVLVMDGKVEALPFLDMLKESRRRGGPPYVLVLTKDLTEQHALQFLAAGADGYLSKTDPPDVVLNAIRKVARGGKYIPDGLAERMVFSMNGPNSRVPLSSREYQVLCMIASGLCVTEIAGRLSLSAKTVSTYRCRLLEKLRLTNNAQLIKYALEQQLAG